MVIAAVLIIGSVGALLLGGLIAGVVILASKNGETRGSFSARQDWMNSHVEDGERLG